VTAVVNR